MSYMHGAASPFGGMHPADTRFEVVKHSPVMFSMHALDGKRVVGEIHVDLPEGRVAWSEVVPYRRGTELAQALYEAADAEVQRLTGNRLTSGSINDRAILHWQRMIKAGRARRDGDGNYVMKNPFGDAERRRLERLAAQGDVEALARLRAQQIRVVGGFVPSRTSPANIQQAVFHDTEEFDFPNGITAYVSWTVDPETGIRRPNNRGDVVWLRAERAASLAIHRRRRIEVRNAYVDSTAYYPGGPGVRVEHGFRHQPIILAFSQEAVESGLLARALALISELNARQLGTHWDRGRGDYTGFCGYQDAYSKVTAKRQYVTCEDCLTIGDEVMTRRRAERRRAARRKPKQNPDDFRSERERRARAYGDPAEVHAAAIEALRTGRMPEDWAVRCQVLAERVRRGEVRVVDPYEHRVYKRGARCLEREDVGMPYTRIVHLVDEEPHSRGGGESYWYVEGPYAEGYSGNRVGWNVDVRNLLAAPMSAGNQSFWIEVRQLNPHLGDQPDPSGYTVVISWLNMLCTCTGPDDEGDHEPGCPQFEGMRRLSEWSVGLCALMDPSADWNHMRQARLRVPPMLVDLFTREEPQTLGDQILSAARRYTRWQTGTAT